MGRSLTLWSWPRYVSVRTYVCGVCVYARARAYICSRLRDVAVRRETHIIFTLVDRSLMPSIHSARLNKDVREQGNKNSGASTDNILYAAQKSFSPGFHRVSKATADPTDESEEGTFVRVASLRDNFHQTPIIRKLPSSRVLEDQSDIAVSHDKKIASSRYSESEREWVMIAKREREREREREMGKSCRV